VLQQVQYIEKLHTIFRKEGILILSEYRKKGLNHL